MRTVARRAAGARRACAQPRGPWESGQAGWEARSVQVSPSGSPMCHPSPRAEAAPEEMETALRSLAARPPRGQLRPISKHPNIAIATSTCGCGRRAGLSPSHEGQERDQKAANKSYVGYFRGQHSLGQLIKSSEQLAVTISGVHAPDCPLTLQF